MQCTVCTTSGGTTW